jgi:hypothetical protein
MTSRRTLTAFSTKKGRCTMAKQQRRPLRNYRNLPPGRFHVFNQRVRRSLADPAKFPESMWAGNPTLIPSYFAASDKHDSTYREATYGSILLIAEREVLQAQLVNYLDEIASILEAAAIRMPDLLLCSGFDLAKERRASTRTKAPRVVTEVTRDAQHGSSQ